MDALPPGVPVAATGYLAAHLQSRHPTTMLPYGLDAAERVIVDLQRPPWPLTYAQLQSRLESLVSRGDFTVRPPTAKPASSRRPAPPPASTAASPPTPPAPCARCSPRRSSRPSSPRTPPSPTPASATPTPTTGRCSRSAPLTPADPRTSSMAHLTLPPGIYRATFRLRWHNDTALPTADPPPAAPLVTIDAFARGPPNRQSDPRGPRFLAPREGQLHEPPSSSRSRGRSRTSAARLPPRPRAPGPRPGARGLPRPAASAARSPPALKPHGVPMVRRGGAGAISAARPGSARAAVGRRKRRGLCGAHSLALFWGCGGRFGGPALHP